MPTADSPTPLSPRAQALLVAWRPDHGLGYDDLVLTFTDEIVSLKEFGSYQGDYVYRVKRDGKEGLLVVGYGSCSGCDALQAALGYAYEEVDFLTKLPDVEALADQLEGDIIWSATSLGESMVARVESKHQGDWWGHEADLYRYLIREAHSIDGTEPPVSFEADED